LLKLSPENRLVIHLPEKTTQTFRGPTTWNTPMMKAAFTPSMLSFAESGPAGKQTFAWVTDFRSAAERLRDASQGGECAVILRIKALTSRRRGLNLEHAYSTDPDVMKSFYYLLQIAHLFLQMFDDGQSAAAFSPDYDTTPVGPFGST